MTESHALPDNFLRQHLIDPELCIRCNTCEETCPTGAITHDSRNYVVNAEICNACLECIGPCPTGSIDNWRLVPKSSAFSLTEQLSWDDLPAQAEIPAEVLQASKAAEAEVATHQIHAPWSAAKPSINLFDTHHPGTATVTANVRVTHPDSASDIHHIVLDFGATPCPVLEGQTIGIIPPLTDANGRPHVMRAYSVASPRDGEQAGRGDIALTVKRVTEDHEGKPYLGVCTNYLCDLQPGESVQLVGPQGMGFLMPNHPGSSLMMICTGTGVAPMRGMIEYRRRTGNREGGSMVLFYGGRTPDEIAYHDEFKALPSELLELNLAYSRVPSQPKQYVQDLLRVRAERVVELLDDENCYIYVCGLKGMEEGIIAAFRDILAARGRDWESVKASLQAKARLHIETY